VSAAMKHFGRLDASVLNAGVSGSGDLIEQSMDDFDRSMAVNVRGVVLGVRAATPAMRETSETGAFCVTASTSGIRADPGMWTYNTSKGAVINYVRSAALDLGPLGIRINAVAPGPTETAMTNRLKEIPEAYEHLRRRMAVQRGSAGHQFPRVTIGQHRDRRHRPSGRRHQRKHRPVPPRTAPFLTICVRHQR
jgi:meso-butanediol dehydrogenase/(S,S)-butanediol dehydrogenase/diacetyl reductase